MGFNTDTIKITSGATNGYVLTSDSVGNATWQLLTSTITYGNVLFVDATNGNDATGIKNRFDKPFLTYSAAQSASSSGDLIYIRRGVFSSTSTSYTLKDGVNIYCEPGTFFNGGFRDNGSPVNCKIYGSGVFGDSSVPALSILGNGSNVYFEFDRIDGVRTFGIFIDHDGACNISCVGNIIRCGTPFRTKTGTKTISLKIKELISGNSTYTIRLGSSSTQPMVGSIYIECPIIENTSSLFARAAILADRFLSDQVIAGHNYWITINATKIRMTNLTMTETRPNIISSCFWWSGGNNIKINSDLEGNACLGVTNVGGGSLFITGSTVINGSVSSNIECVSSNSKFSNGNGWGNIIFKNGLIKSAGLGSSGSVVESGNVWNLVHGGVPGNIQFVNCVLYNSATDGKIVQHDIPNNGTSQNFYFYNCIALTEGIAGFFATSVQPSKLIGLHNVRSNKNNDIMISDPFTPTGFIFDNNLVIPKL